MQTRICARICTMKQTARTTLNLDPNALRAAMQHAHGRTKTEVINQALRSFARQHQQRELLRLRGEIDWQGDLDQLRKRA